MTDDDYPKIDYKNLSGYAIYAHDKDGKPNDFSSAPQALIAGDIFQAGSIIYRVNQVDYSKGIIRFNLLQPNDRFLTWTKND